MEEVGEKREKRGLFGSTYTDGRSSSLLTLQILLSPKHLTTAIYSFLKAAY